MPKHNIEATILIEICKLVGKGIIKPLNITMQIKLIVVEITIMDLVLDKKLKLAMNLLN